MRCRRPRLRNDRRSPLRAPALLAALAFCGLFSVSAGVAAESVSDLRGVSIGMLAQDLPGSGYRNVSCLGAPKQQLEGWHDAMSCPVGQDGLRGLHVEYDQVGQDSTLVAGHPVDLSVFFDASGRLVKIEIKTQDQSSLYMRKKAYRLAHQAMEHYGDEGWTCEKAQPASNEEAIGPMYVNETCSKTSDTRAIEVKSHFFHKVGGSPRDFVSDSLVVVSLRYPEAK
jgi:hypothetical protein